MIGNWIDLAIVVIIGLSILTGLIRGFVKEFIALVVWILAFWIAFNYSHEVNSWLQNLIKDSTVRMATAFIITLLAVLIAGAILNLVLSLILKRSGLSGTDRILGMVFGFVRGLFIIGLIILIINMTSLPHEQYSRESQLYSRFDPLVSWLYSVMPDFIKKAKLFDKQKKQPSSPLPAEQKKIKTSLIDLNDYELSDA